MFGLPLIPEVKKDMAPFNPSHSWLLGERPSLAFAFALAVTAAFTLAGVTYVARASSRYFIVGFPISIALAVWAWQAQPWRRRQTGRSQPETTTTVLGADSSDFHSAHATARSDLGTRRTYSAARSTVSDGERPVRHCSGEDSGGG